MVTLTQGTPGAGPEIAPGPDIPDLPPAVSVEPEEGETTAEEGKGGFVLLIGLALLGGMAVWSMRR